MTKVRLNKPLITTNINGLMPFFSLKSNFFPKPTPKKAGVCMCERDRKNKIK